MSTSFTSTDLKQVLSFPFKDEKWASKLGIAALLSLLGFLIFPALILGGYVYEIMRRVIVQREAPSLPEWDDWGGYLVNGFKMMGVALIYSIPSLLMMIPYMGLTFGLPFLTANGSDVEWVVFPAIMLMFLLMGLGMLLMFLAWVFLLPGWGHMIAKDDFAAAFRIREFWPVLRNNLIGYFLSFVIYMGLMYVVMAVSQILMLTVIFCIFYPIALVVSSVYLSMVMGGLFAQAYMDGVEAAGAKEAALVPAAE